MTGYHPISQTPTLEVKPGQMANDDPNNLLAYLIGHHLISEDQWKIAQHELIKSQQPLATLLVRLGFVSETIMRDAMSATLGQETVELSKMTVDAEGLAFIPREVAIRHCLLPLSWDAATHHMVVAMVDPSDLLAHDKLSALLPPKTQVITKLASSSEINTAIDQAYGYQLNIDGILKEIETGQVDLAALETDKGYSQPTVRLIDAIVTDAVKREASDIHFEPEADFVRIRYRIDGVLRQIRVLHKSYWPAMLVRMKVISGLNIAEVRAPQDGRMEMTVRGHPVDFRVSLLPTIHGENVVLRVLDRSKRELTLEDLGATPQTIATLERMMARPEGIIIVSGPTGSGKTTSLYAMLTRINHEDINIMTLEDPVEFPIPMLRQTAVSETVKLDYAEGIRAMMRQDPDVILVGEIRDSATAEMSFRAAMTGHQVFTTLHTNSSIGVFPRLRDMGVSSQILSGNIIGVVAQRLVRRLCLHCRDSMPINEALKPFFEKISPTTTHIYSAKGCPHCEFSGYKGRLAIFELLMMNEEFDDAVGRDAGLLDLRRIALKHGFKNLAYDGFLRTAEGITTLEEVARVTDITNISLAD